MALLFFGDSLFIRLDPASDGSDETVTAFASYNYRLEDEDYYAIRVGDPERNVVGGIWGIDGQGNLWLTFGPDNVPFMPATVDDLVDRGFVRGTIESLIETAQQLGQDFVEIHSDKNRGAFAHLAD